jgi:very-short-patch-repair endonuclease
MAEDRGSVNLDKILARASSEFEERMFDALADYRKWFGDMESPIEELFLFAFGAYALSENFVDDVHLTRNEVHSKLVKLNQFRGFIVCSIEPQVHVAQYRVDFVVRATLLTAHEDGTDWLIQRFIAVECDGFEFHHGNPERAAYDKARDRNLASEFDAIMRFTGSELHADAYGCAKQVFAVIRAKLA